jgi:hypothetical protein
MLRILHDEFTRRFEQPIIPLRYTKIRHYGYLKNHKRSERLARIFVDLRLPKPPPKVRIPIKQRMLGKKASTLRFVRFVIKERLNEELLISMEFYRPSYLNELLCIPRLHKHLKKMYDINPFSKLQH